MNVTLDVRQLIRNDTEENWVNKNPILLNGEKGFITSGEHAGMSKTGDGTATWTNLPFDKAIANGGNSDTVNNHTVEADVPASLQDIITDLDNIVYRTDTPESVTLPPLVDADTLAGNLPSYFATNSDMQLVKDLIGSLDVSTVQTLVVEVSDIKVSKADKVSSAVDGHLAALDKTGNLVDSGKSIADLAQSGNYLTKLDVAKVNTLKESGLYSFESLQLGDGYVYAQSGLISIWDGSTESTTRIVQYISCTSGTIMERTWDGTDWIEGRDTNLFQKADIEWDTKKIPIAQIPMIPSSQITGLDDALTSYATKEYVNTTFPTKTDVSDTYLTKTDASSTYSTKEYVNSTFYTKALADTTFETKSNASNTYPTKTYVNDTFPTKTYVNDTFPTKTDVNTSLAAKQDKITDTLVIGGIKFRWDTTASALFIEGV